MAEDIETGDVVVTKDTADAASVDLAEVTEVTDTVVKLACYGTRSASPAKAKFYEVFTKGSEVYLGKPRSTIKAKRWTWEIQLEDISELIPLYGLGLNQNGHLNSRSVKLISETSPPLKFRRF